MNRIILLIKKTVVMAVLALSLPLAVHAANTTVTVSQVTSAVTLSADEDYVITSDTPFAIAGSIDITNTEHAVVIIKTVKPSKVISSWLKSHVYINGVQAVNGSNCQVKMYSHGAIIFPYASNIKPLTVYSEQNFAGTSANDFGLENDGGFMNTLTDAKLNNQIRSFKLKRGYMVTFSTRKGGRGYSRCFIADKADLEIATLPTVLDKHITSYRIFQWQNAKKAGLASDTRAAATDATNASWCYSWGVGENRYPDTECVPNHLYEDWPSSSTCGAVTYSCHLKTNNEPGNSSDDHPQDVATVLDNWENLMRTGLRLCSESSHDGSMPHLKAFMDSIDARGWRCDIVDLHCYWDSGTFDNLTWYSNYYGNGRPIWISEWVWGASWNKNGFWAKTSTPGECSESNQTICYNGTKPILDVLNSNTRVERYAYWNSEAAGTHIYDGTSLTTLGEYYANMNDDLGYNADNEFIPKNPRQYDPSNLSVAYDKATKKVTLKWYDANGEYNQTMKIQLKKPGSYSWTDVQVVDQLEDPSEYEVTVDGIDGYKYRVYILDVNGTGRVTNEATAVSESIEYGDAVTITNGTESKVMYLGGNQLVNGDFSFGTTDWTNGLGETIKAPYFQVVPEGGIDGGAYLQCYGSSTDTKSEQSLYKKLSLISGASYYVSAAGCNNSPTRQRISSSPYESIAINARISFPEVTEWTRQAASFTVSNDTLLLIQLRELAGTAQFDDIKVCRLFDTEDEAMADALAWEKKRVEAFKAWNTQCSSVNDELDALAASSTTDANELQEYVDASIENVKATLEANAQEAVTTDYERMLNSMDADYALNSSSLQNPTFAATAGWTTKCGSYTLGDQRTATQAGKTCWNAWWAISATNSSSTMEIKQSVAKVSHGFYAVECLATTQHLCETDQHAYITNGKETAVSPNLPLGKLDLPTFDDDEKWCSLHSSYIYFADGDTATIGFVGSKEGAVDNSWIKYGDPTSTGDNREGWWCATDFAFRYVPAYYASHDGTWGTVCLPRTIKGYSGDCTFYKVAGILEDQSAICIEEVPSTESLNAGYPYICKYTGSDSDGYFIEDANCAAVTSAKTNINGLTGLLSTTAASRYELGSLVLNDGVWTYTETRYAKAKYSAYISKIANLTVLTSWDGEKLPASGIPAGTVSGIDNITDSASSASSYDLQGRKVSDNYSGVVINKSGKHIRK